MVEPSERVPLRVSAREGEDGIRRKVAKKLGIPLEELPPIRILRRSIDARGGRVHFDLVVGFGPEVADEALGGARPREVKGEPRVIVVGDGPAGLFCAYALAREGIACTVLDRGKKVQPRRRDLAMLNREGLVDPDSNYCFGEGGAGTYSDGKLYTRAGKRGDVRDVIELLTLHGAPRAILADARPHIGSNLLPKVVSALRERLEGVGQRFLFDARVTGLLTADVGARRVIRGVKLADGREIGADAVVLATGHSARDVFRFLDDAGVRLEPKAFALGVRVEHPQALINSIQYGEDAGIEGLPAAYYRLAATVEERGVFSFCMCPGGWVVPASTEPGGLVVNGMSLSKRGSPYANSGLVVAIEPEDWQAAGFSGALGGVDFQRRLEESAFVAGGGGLRAPATRVTDLLAGRGSTTVPESSYQPGLAAGDISEVLDGSGHRLGDRMRGALRQFDRRMRGYLTEEAVLIGVESRSSSPVRVPRDRTSLQSPDLDGLYPAGEGAGYAGGIVSAAMDGVRIAHQIAETLGGNRS